jgi:hypothetical protein
MMPYCFLTSNLDGAWIRVQTWGIAMDGIQIKKDHVMEQILTDRRSTRAPLGLWIQLSGPRAPGCAMTTDLAVTPTFASKNFAKLRVQ